MPRTAVFCLSCCLAVLIAAPAVASEPAKGKRPVAEQPVDQWLLAAKVSLGLTFGGAEVYGTPAGEGVTATVGVSMTPLWLSGHGLGVGFEAGIKYEGTQTGEGGSSLRRFPLIGSVHGLLSVAKHWHVVLAGGAQWEVGIESSLGNGDLFPDSEQDLGTELGFMAEAGVLYVAGHLGADMKLRLTQITYHAPDPKGVFSRPQGPESDVDGGSVGVFIGLHYLF